MDLQHIQMQQCSPMTCYLDCRRTRRTVNLIGCFALMSVLIVRAVQGEKRDITNRIQCRHHGTWSTDYSNGAGVVEPASPLCRFRCYQWQHSWPLRRRNALPTALGAGACFGLGAAPRRALTADPASLPLRGIAALLVALPAAPLRTLRQTGSVASLNCQPLGSTRSFLRFLEKLI